MDADKLFFYFFFVFFLFNLVKSLAALISTLKPQHSKSNLSVLYEIHTVRMWWITGNNFCKCYNNVCVKQQGQSIKSVSYCLQSEIIQLGATWSRIVTVSLQTVMNQNWIAWQDSVHTLITSRGHRATEFWSPSSHPAKRGPKCRTLRQAGKILNI